MVRANHTSEALVARQGKHTEAIAESSNATVTPPCLTPTLGPSRPRRGGIRSTSGRAGAAGSPCSSGLFNVFYVMGDDSGWPPEGGLERLQLAIGRPDLELCVADGENVQAECANPFADLHLADDTVSAAIQRLGDTKKRRQHTNGPQQPFRQIGDPGMRAGRGGTAVIASHQRDDLDFVGLKAPEIPVLDEIVGMTVVFLVADVVADVVQR